MAPKVAAPIASAPVAIFLCQKANVVGDLTDGLEQALLVKNNQKQAYDIGVEEIKHLNICEKLSIKKGNGFLYTPLGYPYTPLGYFYTPLGYSYTSPSNWAQGTDYPDCYSL